MTSFTKETKPTTTFTKYLNIVNDFLLMENGSYLLLETSDRIILEQSTGSAFSTSFTKETKPTTSFSKEAKP